MRRDDDDRRAETNPFRAARLARQGSRDEPREQPAGANASFAARLRAAVARRGRGRRRVGRALLLPALAWILWRHLGDPFHASIVSGLNLVVHEAGHLFFGWFGRLPGVAGGTVMELLVPVLVAVLFFRHRDDFGVAVALFWLGTALVDVGVYAADARNQALPLVSPVTGSPEHDWTYLLMRFGALRHDRLIGTLFRRAGLAAMAAGLVGGAWIVRQLARDGAPGAA